MWVFLHCRPDVLIVTEKVRRVVFVLQNHEPIVIRAEGGFDAINPLLGLETNVIDRVAAGREGAHRLRHIARPADIGGVFRRIQPNRVAASLAERGAMAEPRFCGIDCRQALQDYRHFP